MKVIPWKSSLGFWNPTEKPTSEPMRKELRSFGCDYKRPCMLRMSPIQTQCRLSAIMPPSIDTPAISLLLLSSSFRTREPINTPSKMLVSLAGATTVRGAYFKASNTNM